MEFLIIVLLGGAVVWLWNRVDRLESRLDMIVYLPEPIIEQERAATADTTADREPAVITTRHESSPEAAMLSGVARPATIAHEAARSIESVNQGEPDSAQMIDDSSELGADATSPDDSTDDYAPEPRFNFDFEDIFGRRLPIWAGGITLAIAGVFLVRYSIESGLLTPAVRVALAFVFGLLLLAGAEWAFRNEQKIADERVRQSLAGAGLATLYAAFYLAGTQYGLIGQTMAFLGLAVVTAGAISLSFRFGLPCAILGLVGGFAAPALVGGEQANLPLLSLYLGLVTAGLTVTGNRQARPWLSIAALVFGLGWGALLLFAGDPGVPEILALGLYFIVLGAVLPAFAGAEGYARPLRFGSALVASVQLALLVDQGGYAPLAWGLYLLLGATLAFFAWRKPELRETGAIAAVVSVLLLAQWRGAEPVMFALVAGGIAGVYAGVALAHVWRGGRTQIDLAQLVGVPLALAGIAYATFSSFEANTAEPQLALAFAALAILPLAGAWRLWRSESEAELSTLLAAGSLLGFGALLLLTPAWAAVIAAALTFTSLFALLRRREELVLWLILWGFAGITLVALFSAVEMDREFPSLAGLDRDADALRAGLRWLAAFVPWAALAWTERSREARFVAEALAAVIAYGLAAQFLPPDTLAWVAALGAGALWFLQRSRTAAQLSLVAITVLWAAWPLGEWGAAGFVALAGDPVFLGDVPAIKAIFTRLLPLCACLALIRIPMDQRFGPAAESRWLAVIVGLVIAHSLFKQAFAIDTVTQFVVLGLAERTVWQALLLGGAFILHRGTGQFGPQPRFAALAAGLALMHGLWFSGLLHNPLWDRQAVGPTPIANLVLAAGFVAGTAALFMRRHAAAIVRPAIDAGAMLIASFTALALLRQAFAGTVLVNVPMGETEDLLRSLLGIILALAFLFAGKISDERSWRIGSLAVMLLAVAKVFVWDAAGLEGLFRVASFMALGFSLIGIGWVYARQLKSGPQASRSQ